MLLDHWQEALILLHLSTIGPAFLMGTYIMLNKKGTQPHKRLGRVYMGLMLLTALVTLLISRTDRSDRSAFVVYQGGSIRFKRDFLGSTRKLSIRDPRPALRAPGSA